MSARRVSPALLTRTSMRPKASTVRAAMRSIAFRSPTSVSRARLCLPRSVAAAAVASAAAPSTSAATTRAPAPAKASAMARPMPLPAPVTIAT